MRAHQAFDTVELFADCKEATQGSVLSTVAMVKLLAINKVEIRNGGEVSSE